MTQKLSPSTRELMESGRRLRQQTPRSRLADMATGSRDPLGILEEQNAPRVRELVPLRIERMAQSAFAFYRGAAALMAADLADAPHSGIYVTSCGDAHVANFGFYASPQRTLVFDLNDFDEAAWAPWEWDLKRLVTSVIIAGRETSRDESVITKAARTTITAYRTALRSQLELSPVQRYYTHIDAQGGANLLDTNSQAVLQAAVTHAHKRTGDRAVRKLTTRDRQGRYRFVMAPPTMVPLESDVQERVEDHIAHYRRSAAPDIQVLLNHYRQVDTARRVVGVGSVGTRCALVLFQDGDGNGLIMQAKQANRSVLEQYGRIEQPAVLHEVVSAAGEGARVVSAQRILQGVSDPFLGHLRAPDVDLYVRQFRDMKTSIEVTDLDDGPFITYAQACGVTLARAHSQSVPAAKIAGYFGSGEILVDALLEWAMAYADVSADDYRDFLRAQHGG